MIRLRAGSSEDLPGLDSLWCFLDIGFSASKPSCGLLVGDGTPAELLFSEAKQQIIRICSTSDLPVSLVIEAPLSVSFSPEGNPRGRSIEKHGSQTRYWYVGLGCTVMTAAGFILCELAKLRGGPEIRLFEGFVSFKAKNTASNHSNDVLLLRDIAHGSGGGSIIDGQNLAMGNKDHLESAFKAWGLDYGIPAAIVAS